MAFTDQCDLFGSVHEDGVNKLIGHFMRKRPSLFNYGTEWVAEGWQKRLCEPPKVAPEVRKRNNPVVSVEQPIPILGTGGFYALNFAAQLVDLRIDLHPSSMQLPPQLGAELGEQHFALYGKVCAGLGCPVERGLEEFPPAPQPPIRLVGSDDREGRDKPKAEVPHPDRVIVLPTDRLHCCCMELFVVGHAETTGDPGNRFLELKLDGLELRDIKPDCLEANLECYLRMLLHYVILPRLRISLDALVFEIHKGLPELSLSPSTTVPNNPAAEDDLLKIFVDLEVVA